MVEAHFGVDVERCREIIGERGKCYTCIVIKDFDQESSQRILKTISSVYPNERPMIYCGKLIKKNLFTHATVLPDGSLGSTQESSFGQFVNGIGHNLAGNKGKDQPTDYMLQRNALSEPLWLINTIEDCFQDLDRNDLFPKINPSDEEDAIKKISDLSFHSPSLSEEQSLVSIYHIFDSLNLLDVLSIDKGTLSSTLPLTNTVLRQV